MLQFLYIFWGNSREVLELHFLGAALDFVVESFSELRFELVGFGW
jgi:hypothetical protein